MLKFAKYAAEHWGGQLEELIHTPLGYGVKNGQQVPLSFWGAATNADHFDHVHLADTDPPDARPTSTAGRPSPVRGGRRRRRRLRRRRRRLSASAASACRCTSCAGTARAGACPTSPALPTTSPPACARCSTT